MENKQKDARDLVLIFLAVLLVCINLFREWQQYPTEKGARVQGIPEVKGQVVKGPSEIALPLIKPEARNDSFLNPRPLEPSNPALTSGEAKQVLGIKIDINKASRQDFESLPNIGPKLAKNIIEKRDELNGFKSIDDIKKVKGIGEKKFEKIRDLIDVM